MNGASPSSDALGNTPGKACPAGRGLATRWLLLGLAFLLLAPDGAAQSRKRPIEEPRWMKLRISESSAGVMAEGVVEETTFTPTGDSIRHTSIFVGPSIGLDAEGSIYHPNLVRFRLNTEGGYGWGEDRVETPTSSMHRSQMEYLGHFAGSADLFGNKPLNGSLFGNYDHSYRDYDFFNRVTVDTLRYGAQLNYNKKPFSAMASYSHQDEDAFGIVGLTTSEQDVITLMGRHDRLRGTTVFNYSFAEYTRSDFGLTGVGSDHTISLADSEKFGARDQLQLNSGASYSRRDSFNQPSDEFRANAALAADHRPGLTSAYDLDFSRYTIGAFASDNYSGRAYLRHQLYESLTSTLSIQASDNETSDAMNSGYIRRFGGGLGETYTKRLGENHRLTVNNTLFLEHVEQDSITTIENERHAFSGSVGGSGFSSFFLDLPNVIEFSISVTDARDTAPGFVRGIDYGVTSLGSRTLIERLPGSRIPAGSTVFVDYRTEPTAAGSYDAMSEVFQIRVDLWKNIWGVYARMNLYVHNAPSNLRVQSLTSYAFGSDVTWRWLRAGAEYEIYNSDQSDYRAIRLYQSLSFKPDAASSLGFELSESWTDYQDADRQEENYRFITLYHRSMTHRLRLNFDAGIHLRRGRDVDQMLATVRPGIEYVVGKTTLRAGYDFEHQLFLEREERSKHLLFLRLKRVF